MVRRFIVLLLLLSPFSVAQSKRPFTFDDMMKLKRVAEPYLSPDGKWAAFTVTDVSLEENKKTNHIWIIPVAGGDARQLTNGKGEDGVRFSPDGKQVLYISSADGSSQVWTHSFDTTNGMLSGEPHKLTSIATEASAAIWSPDGKSILFVSGVYPDCRDEACNKSRDEERSKSKVKAQVFTHLLYRHWNAYGDGKRSHLFILPVAGGTAVDLTPGDHDVPPFSLGGQDQYAFSPDGKEIAYASNLDEVEATSTNTDVFVLPTSGGTPKKISTSPGADSTPLYSPDGKYIAFRSQARGGYESDRFRLMLYDRASGNTTELTPKFDRWVNTVAWAPDSKGIYFTSEDKGEAPIYYVDLKGGPKLVMRGFNDGLAFAPGGKTMVFDRMSVRFPNELYAATWAGDAPVPCTTPASMGTVCTAPKFVEKPLTHINAPVLDQVAMQPIEPFTFEGAEGAKVQGFVVKPPDFDAKKKYPVKFLIHGGPQGAWGDDWSYRWNPELFAASGYVVIMVNPRGSTGYGQQFIDDINGDWGGRAYEDLMKGLDYAEKNFAYVDKNRECALGASYGGYMANWLEGNTTRFKCIVSHDGMFNTISAFGTTEELWFNTWEFKGTPWTNPDTYRKWSPNLKVENFKTPMLVVHGQLDYRLDVSEGFQLFTSLQMMKVPSKMLYFPDEGHWVLKPQNSQLWWKTVTEWVDQWTKTAN
jgi:dipeptidyl aminopeptidase/acylaminoacyl peptidase